ncbi:hypothetical protein RI367_004341 [Sorochytrium milnesiophthora]
MNARPTTGARSSRLTPIKDQKLRRTTFTKRKEVLLRKAHELALLCSCEIAIVMFDIKGRLFQFSSTGDVDQTLLKYSDFTNPPTEAKSSSDYMDLSSAEVLPPPATVTVQTPEVHGDNSHPRQLFSHGPVVDHSAIAASMFYEGTQRSLSTASSLSGGSGSPAAGMISSPLPVLTDHIFVPGFLPDLETSLLPQQQQQQPSIAATTAFDSFGVNAATLMLSDAAAATRGMAPYHHHSPSALPLMDLAMLASPARTPGPPTIGPYGSSHTSLFTSTPGLDPLATHHQHQHVEPVYGNATPAVDTRRVRQRTLPVELLPWLQPSADDSGSNARSAFPTMQSSLAEMAGYRQQHHLIGNIEPAPPPATYTLASATEALSKRGTDATETRTTTSPGTATALDIASAAESIATAHAMFQYHTPHYGPQ